MHIACRHNHPQAVKLPDEQRALEQALREAQAANWRFAEQHGTRVPAEEFDASSARLLAVDGQAAAGQAVAGQAALGEFAHATVRFAVGETAKADEKVRAHTMQVQASALTYSRHALCSGTMTSAFAWVRDIALCFATSVK